MNYELAKKLKDAGFPHDFDNLEFHLGMIRDGNVSPDSTRHPWKVEMPTLSELIEACGAGDLRIERSYLRLRELWIATILRLSVASNDSENVYQGNGSTPEEAVANLWLALLNK